MIRSKKRRVVELKSRICHALRNGDCMTANAIGEAIGEWSGSLSSTGVLEEMEREGKLKSFWDPKERLTEGTPRRRMYELANPPAATKS